jgi:hypothetical protein
VTTIYLSGISQVLLGIQTLLNSVGYNMFADNGTLPCIMFILAFCLGLKKLCTWLGMLLGVWKIDETIIKLEKKEQEETIATMFKRILNPAQFKKDIGIRETPQEVRFDPTKWRMVDRIKLEED